MCHISAGGPPRDDRPVRGPPAGTLASGEIVTAAVDRYLDSIKTKTTRSSYAGTLARLVSCAGGRDTASLLPEDYAVVMDRWDDAAGATWNRHLSALTSFTAWAGRQEILTASPARRLERRKPARRSDRAIPRARLDKLLTDDRHGLRERVLWLQSTASLGGDLPGVGGHVEDLLGFDPIRVRVGADPIHHLPRPGVGDQERDQYRLVDRDLQVPGNQGRRVSHGEAAAHRRDLYLFSLEDLSHRFALEHPPGVPQADLGRLSVLGDDVRTAVERPQTHALPEVAPGRQPEGAACGGRSDAYASVEEADRRPFRPPASGKRRRQRRRRRVRIGWHMNGAGTQPASAGQQAFGCKAFQGGPRRDHTDAKARCEVSLPGEVCPPDPEAVHDFGAQVPVDLHLHRHVAAKDVIVVGNLLRPAAHGNPSSSAPVSHTYM